MPSDPNVSVTISTEDPGRCACGHDNSGWYMCLNGRIYGPCESEFCDGVCDDTWGTCKGDCKCERESQR